MRDLIARIEAATGPDRALDVAIVAAITPGIVGVERGPLAPDTCSYLFRYDPPRAWSASWLPVPSYTASIDAALTLVPDDHWWEVGRSCGDNSAMRNFGARRGCFSARAVPWGASPRLSSAPTPALALCAAALRARLAMQEAADV